MVLYFTTTLNNQSRSRKENTMFRLTCKRCRVPNQIAVLAAFLLLAATVATVNQAADRGMDTGPNVVHSEEAPATVATTANRDKGFKLNLYLFRRN